MLLRRTILGWPLGAAALAWTAGARRPAAATTPTTRTPAPTPTPTPARRPSRPGLRAICFDLFTLFDPRSVVRVATGVVPGTAAAAASLCDTWRVRQFEYAWLRVAGGRYRDFRAVTEEALVFAARARGLTLSAAARDQLVDACSELDPWPDTRATLLEWKRQGLKLAPLSNYSPAMLERLMAHAGLTELFDALISTDAAQTFKPDARAYALGPRRLGVSRDEIAFAAFGGWDAAGAKWFGYPTFWVNRLGVAPEALDPPPDGTGPTLAELSKFVVSW